MKRLTTILAYGWALMMVPLILATFIGMPFWAEKLVGFTGLRVSPWFSGGEVAQIVKHEQYDTIVHRLVFDGLIGEKKKGFVQIDFKAEEGPFPEVINEQIDYDQDGNSDVLINLNTKTNEVTFEPYNQQVIGLGEVLTLDKERIIRVILKKS